MVEETAGGTTEGRISQAGSQRQCSQKGVGFLKTSMGVKRSHFHSSCLPPRQQFCLAALPFPSPSPPLHASKQFLIRSLRLGQKLLSLLCLGAIGFSTNTLRAMDGDLKKPRVQFSGVGKGSSFGRQTSAIPPQESAALGRAGMTSSGEYDAAFAATIAAAAFAIAAREEKLATQKNNVPIEAVPPALSPVKRGESMKRPGGSKISRWFSSKEPVENDDDGPVNVSVRRPLKPAPGKPEEIAPDHKVAPKMLESFQSVKKGSGSSNKAADRKGSKKFGQEQATQKVPSTVRPATSYHSRRNEEGAAGVTAIGATGSKAEEWERAKLARVREEYEKMIETITEWETEKKVKARRQKEQKETELDRKRAKALEEYNQEMTRINKIAGGARSMAEERRYNDEKKIKEKARKIQSTGKLPRTCACF